MFLLDDAWMRILDMACGLFFRGRKLRTVTQIWYIMTVVMIVHNMITERERRKDLGYSFYELMEKPMQPRKREDYIRRFLEVYHAIRNSNTH